jgi:hypothetical protein
MSGRLYAPTDDLFGFVPLASHDALDKQRDVTPIPRECERTGAGSEALQTTERILAESVFRRYRTSPVYAPRKRGSTDQL